MPSCGLVLRAIPRILELLGLRPEVSISTTIGSACCNALRYSSNSERVSINL